MSRKRRWVAGTYLGLLYKLMKFVRTCGRSPRGGIRTVCEITAVCYQVILVFASNSASLSSWRPLSTLASLDAAPGAGCPVRAFIDASVAANVSTVRRGALASWTCYSRAIGIAAIPFQSHSCFRQRVVEGSTRAHDGFRERAVCHAAVTFQVKIARISQTSSTR